MALEELKKLAAQTETPAAPEADAGIYYARQSERAQAAEMKERITQQLRKGSSPANILLTAIQAIGLLTADASWMADCTAALESVYGDLSTQEAAETAVLRAELQQAEYIRKARAALERQHHNCRELYKTIAEALKTLDEMKATADTTE